MGNVNVFNIRRKFICILKTLRVYEFITIIIEVYFYIKVTELKQ